MFLEQLTTASLILFLSFFVESVPNRANGCRRSQDKGHTQHPSPRDSPLLSTGHLFLERIPGGSVPRTVTLGHGMHQRTRDLFQEPNSAILTLPTCS